MSSTSPGQHCAHKQFATAPNGEFLQSKNVTSPEGGFVISRQLPGYPEGSEICSRDSGYCVNTSDGASTCSSSTTDATEGEGGTLLVLEPKSLRSFTTNDEYVYAMKEDLADWFSCLYKLDITADNFFSVLETGVLLCQHANKVQDFSRQRREQGETLEMRSYFIRSVPVGNVPCKENVKPETFQARDNVSNFISWGRQLGIPEVLSFETDDLVLRKNEKSVILCLLEIARVGAKLGMLAPTLVQMEEEIDAELAGEEVQPKAQIKTCDLRSLDEMVRDLVGRCKCPIQFPMVKVGDGKYKIGDSRSLIFVRILRNHVMVRVGGGWDTLENYLNKHDPCQCNYRGHRATSLGPNISHKVAVSSQKAGSNANLANNTASPRPGNTTLSPRRMSTPSVAVTTSNRNRSSSPKHPTRSKSPTLIISRHMQGNTKPQFSVNNSKNSTGTDSSVSLSTDGAGGVAAAIAKVNSTNQNNAVMPDVSKSWSQSSGFSSKIPTVGAGAGQPNRSKSPSPAPSTNVSRLRSPSPKTTSLTESGQVKGHHVMTRASSSSALLTKGKGHGEVKVGTPRTIKRAAMNRAATAASFSSDFEEEDDEYDNEDDDDDFDDMNDQWKDDNVSKGEEDLQFSCEDIGDDKELYLRGSVSFDNSCQQSSRSGLESVSESEAPEPPGGGKKSNVAVEKVSTMTLTEFKSLLTSALSVPEEHQQSQQSLKDRGNPNSCVKPSSLQFSTSSGGTTTGITSTASTPGASDSNKQLNWDSLRDKARLVRDSISTSVSSRKTGIGNASPGIGRRSLPQSPDDDGSRPRVPYSGYGDRPKTPQALRRNSANSLPSSRPKTPTSSISRPKTPTAIARPKTPSGQSRVRSSSSMERTAPSREEYKMARPKTPSQMKREAVAKVAGAISNWVESRNEMDSAPSAAGGRPKTPVGYKNVLVDENDECNAEIMGTLANDRVDGLALSIRERPSTPSRIPKPCFTPRPATPKRSGDVEESISMPNETEELRYSVPATPPQSLSLSQHTYDSSLTTPDADSVSKTPHTNIPHTKVISRSQRQPAQSAPSTPGSTNGNRSMTSSTSSKNTNTSSKTYKDMYVAKRATTPTQLFSRSQPARCVTPGPREKWSLGESAENGSQSRISSQNGVHSSRVSQRRGSLNTDALASSYSSQFVVTNEITFSDDEEINEMLQNAAKMKHQEKKKRSASVDARKLVRQNANAGPKEVVVISRNSKGMHSVNVPAKGGGNSSNTTPVKRPRSRGPSTDRSSSTAPARFRSQTPDPSMFRRKLSTAKSVGSDDIDSGHVGSKSGTKSINRTEAWVDSTLSDTKRKLPPRPKRANTLGGDIHSSELQPRPLEEIRAILPDQQNVLVHIDSKSLDAPPEDPEMFKKMEKLFEKYREMELRASVNEVPGGGKSGGNKHTNPSPSNRSFNASSKSTPSVTSGKTSSGSLHSSSGSKSSNYSHPSTQPKVSSGKPNSVRSTASKDNRYNRASSVPRSFQKSPSGTPPVLSPAQHQKDFVYADHPKDQVSENHITSLKDIDSETAKDPTALISKIKEILRVRPRKDENSKVPTRIPAPASLSKYKRSKSVSNLFDSGELTLKENHTDTNYNQHSNHTRNQTSNRPQLHKSNSTSSTNISYSEFVFTEDNNVEETDAVSDLNRAWSVQSDSNSSDSNNRCETPVPKLATPLTTGRSTFINRKLDRNGRGLSQDKENALSNSQSSLSSRSALSATEDEADYV